MLAPSAWRCMGARPPGCSPRSSLLAAHASGRRPTVGLDGPMLTRVPVSYGGGGVRVVQPLRRPVLAAAMQGEHVEGEEPARRKSSSYRGVSWDQSSSAWRADLHKKCIGRYASEEDAARAYDYAAVRLLGLQAERNFPDEVISEPPLTRRKASKTSRFSFGVSWHTRSRSWQVFLRNTDTQCNEYIGRFSSEEDAARAYDCAAELHGLDRTKRNFPDDHITKPPQSEAGL
ncbi:hypothetical protein FOA52_013785 [Chlamydomonas sp. UWO 241]|nr:hypothetical protein FOA52_013785 [Chlamydomonas sp. UWO 241]